MLEECNLVSLVSALLDGKKNIEGILKDISEKLGSATADVYPFKKIIIDEDSINVEFPFLVEVELIHVKSRAGSLMIKRSDFSLYVDTMDIGHRITSRAAREMLKNFFLAAEERQKMVLEILETLLGVVKTEE